MNDNWKCYYPLCYGEIKIGEKYIIESTSSGKPKKWHLCCYDLFLNRILTEYGDTYPTIIKNYKEYQKKREDMIKIRK